jgi:hypothetical protein
MLSFGGVYIYERVTIRSEYQCNQVVEIRCIEAVDVPRSLPVFGERRIIIGCSYQYDVYYLATLGII